MPIRHRIDLKLGIVLSTAEGILTDTDLQEHQKSLYSDPNWRPTFNELSDLRTADFQATTASGIRKLASDVQAGEPRKFALVVSTDLAFGISRMFQVLADESSADIRVYRDITEARRWLGPVG